MSESNNNFGNIKDNKHALIVSGGEIDINYLRRVYRTRPYMYVIGVDGGVKYLNDAGITPTHIIGDFDSLPRGIFESYCDNPDIKTRIYSSDKDYSDTYLAVKLSVELGSTFINMLGCMGRRIDHSLSNIYSLKLPLEAKIPCIISDSKNKIMIIDKSFKLSRDSAINKYISLYALDSRVDNLSLKGFKYNVSGVSLEIGDCRFISNEIVDDSGYINFDKGRILLIISND